MRKGWILAMKILHSADWHLDSPLLANRGDLGKYLLSVPDKLAELVQLHRCDLVLLSGDLFDVQPTKETLKIVKAAMGRMEVPVFIAPGNHDYCGVKSPWNTEIFPKNVHIFTENVIESVSVDDLDLTVYGAGYTAMDCPGLLQNFRVKEGSRYHVGVLHGDPMLLNSPYCPITAEQVRQSGLHYLALGHIHRRGSFRAGSTTCAWPGCPMGRGYDEQGQKGVYLVTLEDRVRVEFISLDMPQFHDLTVDVTGDPVAALDAVLPGAGNGDYIRVTLTGEGDDLNIPALQTAFSRFPNLKFRDQTAPALDIWAGAGEDTLEGVYFRLLRDTMEGQDDRAKRLIKDAASISRKLMNGQEVDLP